MKIFLDDVRNPKDCLGYMHTRIGNLNPIYEKEWYIVRDYDEFVNIILDCFRDNIKITHISFDHDLADEHYDDENVDINDYDALYETFKEKTGLDCAKWLKEYYEDINIDLPTIFVHSMNPVGRQNIINIFN